MPNSAIAAIRRLVAIGRLMNPSEMFTNAPLYAVTGFASAARRDLARPEHLRHVGVDDGREVEREHLREDESADHREPERPARFAAGAEPGRDRQRAEQRRHRRHHDRAEPDEAAFVDRFGRRHAELALGVEREVDLHDRVLLDDPDQHDQADKGIDIQLVAESPERDERAQARRRQTRKNRDRVDVALVQRAQDDVDHADRDEEQQPEVLRGLLEHLGRALEGDGHGRRQQVRRHLPDAIDGGAERDARAQPERDVHRREAGPSG